MSFLLIVNVVFMIAFLIHMFFIAYSMIHPDTPTIKIYEKSLNEIEFPLSIKLCASEDRESDVMRHNTSGYERNFNFFLGQSMFNKSLIGWSGHTQDGSFLGSVKGKNKLNSIKSRAKKVYLQTLLQIIHWRWRK